MGFQPSVILICNLDSQSYRREFLFWVLLWGTTCVRRSVVAAQRRGALDPGGVQFEQEVLISHCCSSCEGEQPRQHPAARQSREIRLRPFAAPSYGGSAKHNPKTSRCRCSRCIEKCEECAAQMKRFGIPGLGRLILLFVGALALSTALHRLRMTPEQRAQEIGARKTQEAKDQQRAKEDAMVAPEKRADAERKIVQKRQRKDEGMNWKVQQFCEDYVQNYLLKAPSTAHFGGEAFVRIPGTNVHSGSFWVDSRNSFGAMVRTHFRCSVTDYVGRFHDLRVEQVKW